uniref:CSD domain-containing protein n=1 Tax=Globodera rostochiensis TaxID=31243 RepID=A0A914I760_GLORO
MTHPIEAATTVYTEQLSNEVEKIRIADAVSNRPSQRVIRSPIVLERGVSGRVKWFDFWKGYGFITRDDGGQDVFLHASAIVRKVKMHFVLIEGQKLEFDIIDGEKGREAAVVSGPGGMRVGTAIQYNPQQQLGGGKNIKRMISAGRFMRPAGKQNTKDKAVVVDGSDGIKGSRSVVGTRNGRRNPKSKKTVMGERGHDANAGDAKGAQKSVSTDDSEA